jgi:hypothetical protein
VAWENLFRAANAPPGALVEMDEDLCWAEAIMKKVSSKLVVPDSMGLRQ